MYNICIHIYILCVYTVYCIIYVHVQYIIHTGSLLPGRPKRRAARAQFSENNVYSTESKLAILTITLSRRPSYRTIAISAQSTLCHTRFISLALPRYLYTPHPHTYCPGWLVLVYTPRARPQGTIVRALR